MHNQKALKYTYHTVHILSSKTSQKVVESGFFFSFLFLLEIEA